MISGLLASGLFGVLGSFANNVLGYFSKKQADAQALALEDSRRKTAMAVSDASIREAEARTRGAVALADVAAFTASYGNDKATYAGEKARNSYLMVVVDFLRGVIRPVLTLSLVCLSWLIYNDAHAMAKSLSATGLGVSPAEVTAIYAASTEGITYLTTMVVGWWFGNRAHDKTMAKLR